MTPSPTSTPTTAGTPGEVRNWSESLRFTPSERAAPPDEDAVVEAVRRAADDGRTVRPIGSGHSSMPIMATEDVLVSLEQLQGLVHADVDAGRATVLGGTTLKQAGAAFASHGLAMPNLGDVDLQVLAGAIGTGTHGTGITLGNLSTILVGGRLVTGTGEVVPFGEEAADGDDAPVDPHDLLRAARVSLGSLGIMTSLTVALVPAFDLHRLNWCTHIDWVLEHFADLVEQNARFDFYWYPRSDLAQVRTMNEPGSEPDLVPPGAHVHADETGPSYEIIPNDRTLKFDEMEYMLPYDVDLSTFREIRQRIKDRHRHQVGWRVLVRTVAADDSMISNCNGRPTMTIALLQNAQLPHDEYFADLEPVLRAADGRPHWGKKHTAGPDDLARHYPEWDRFREIRRTLDPEGVLLNDHLRALFGEEER